MSSAAKILLIEDDAGITDTLRRVFSEEGHDVSVQKRGDDGLALASRETFNVVITALRLPGIDGLVLVCFLFVFFLRLPIKMKTAFGTPKNTNEEKKLDDYE